MISVREVEVTLSKLELPSRTVRRLTSLLLRSHIEELVLRIPQALVPHPSRRRVWERLWCLLGDGTLGADEHARRQAIVRGLIATYRDTSDVLHGRRVQLSPDPVELRRWADHVRAGCELLRPPDDLCAVCGSFPRPS
jgi:hypothetical protein